MNRHQTLPAVVCFLALLIFANAANAQSKDQDNPTPLTSNVISGTVSPDYAGDKYYYSFVAGPGDVTITLTVESAGRDVVQVGFALFDEREVQLGTYKSATTGSGGTAQAVENVSVKRGQHVLLLIQITPYTTGQGKYRLRVSGAVEFGQEKSTYGISGNDTTTQAALNPSKNKTNYSECLPRQGTLIIKMKDGSKKIIDLSEAETVTIVP